MSLYNMMFGVNNRADTLLACLGLTKQDVPRFRDCFVDNGEIIIHTRTGGGNRDDYEEENSALQANANYLYDEDDDFDCTYANFHFSFPEEYASDLKQIGENDVKPSDKWKALLSSMISPK